MSDALNVTNDTRSRRQLAEGTRIYKKSKVVRSWRYEFKKKELEIENWKMESYILSEIRV